MKTFIENPTDHPALMIRMKVVGGKTGERILPILYSDNYISLMPGEARTIKMTLENADTRGEEPVVMIEGFNVK